jgi:hypothetical protein
MFLAPKITLAETSFPKRVRLTARRVFLSHKNIRDLHVIISNLVSPAGEKCFGENTVAELSFPDGKKKTVAETSFD